MLTEYEKNKEKRSEQKERERKNKQTKKRDQSSGKVEWKQGSVIEDGQEKSVLDIFMR